MLDKYAMEVSKERFFEVKESKETLKSGRKVPAYQYRSEALEEAWDKMMAEGKIKVRYALMPD